MRVVGLAIILLLSMEAHAMQSSGKQIIRTGPDLNLPFSPAVKAGGFVYASGAISVDEKGQFAPGDVQQQTRNVLDQLARVLEAAGSGLANAAAVNVYLKRAADFQAMNQVYRTYWPKDPPVRTTIVADLAIPEALVEISLVAVPVGAERRVVHPSDWAPSPNPYSYGIRSGDTLFVAGMTSRDRRSGAAIPGDMATQTRTVLGHIGEVLAAEGLTHANVVSSRIYITDAAAFQDMNAAYRSVFSSDPPARATVRADLMGGDSLIEITTIAVAGDRAVVTTPNADGSPGRANPNLSSAIRTGGHLYVSGLLGATEETKGDIAGQMRVLLERAERTLEAAGYEWAHVVEGVVYLTDLGLFPQMNAAYREVFGRDFPARATVRTGLMSPDGLVEIMFTAVK